MPHFTDRDKTVFAATMMTILYIYGAIYLLKYIANVYDISFLEAILYFVFALTGLKLLVHYLAGFVARANDY